MITHPHALRASARARSSLQHRKKSQYALAQCEKALTLWSGNFKAAWRAGKACVELGRWQRGQEVAQMGLAVAPDNAALKKVLAAAQEGAQRAARAEAAAAKRKQEHAAQLQVIRDACKERHMRVGPPLFIGMRRGPEEPHFDSYGCLHWPVLLLYPALGHSEYVQAWPEVVSFQDQLAHMLPQDKTDAVENPAAVAAAGRVGRAPWDQHGAYRLDNVEVFYCTNQAVAAPLESAWQHWLEGDVLPAEPDSDAVKEVSAKAVNQDWVRVPLDAPLMLPMVQPDYVVPEIPVFYVVARGTGFYAEARANMKRLTRQEDFRTLEVPDFGE